jgi:hypothetical protein
LFLFAKRYHIRFIKSWGEPVLAIILSAAKDLSVRRVRPFPFAALRAAAHALRVTGITYIGESITNRFSSFDAAFSLICNLYRHFSVILFKGVK